MRRTKLVSVALLSLMVLLGCGQSVSGYQSLADRYVRGIADADADSVRDLLHPDWLYGEVSEPLLRATAASLRESLGRFTGADSCQVLKKLGGEGIAKVRCQLRFEKGSGTLLLHVKDGRVLQYDFKSPELTAGWLKRPNDLSPWRDKAQTFLEALATGDRERAYDMTSLAFQNDVSREQFVADAQGTAERFGELQEVAFVSETASAQPTMIELIYRVTGSKKTSHVAVRFWAGLVTTGVVGLVPATPEQVQGGS